MIIISLFDGISCGRIALERAGIKVDKYFASEIDKNAIKVSKDNWPDIIQIGDVTKVKWADGILYTENGNFECPNDNLMVIGGSPCQGFSFAGKELNFEDPRSKLFFEFVRLVKECRPKYFLLENVVMQKKFEDIITEHVGVKPVFINSNLISGQNRKRLYWTNIPFEIPEDKNIKFSEILGDNDFVPGKMVGRRICPETGRRNDSDRSIKIRQYIELAPTDKSNCLTTVCKDNILVRRGVKHGALLKDVDKNDWKYMEPAIYEKLQTVPDGYTESVSKSARTHALGNGWTVDVIAHIFKGIE